ncbi:hypothetical protein K504DRAFT_481450 [Pleomassaria siparia CBS 279.74]|uniref:CWH43-like N-terminal domain-containing protein n=1 Tax=Pleomassaria siparia CBS 279.74 TaxID=1314801 RepID=A0A6G1KD89_9PLEO|nr:hypothetical protein K504DRAFT_481450 [Pleomassaria siparia CBS 279.74]
MWGISYWAVPIFSALVWLAMLIAMLTTWTSQGEPHYASMDQSQKIAYISDIGAQGLKPLFIAMSTVTVVSFDIAFILERWLRHTGKLARNTSKWQKLFSVLSIVFAIAGAAGLILLSIFDTLRHPTLHDIFLVIFIGGYIISAVFICWEYQRLGIHFREHSVLRYSFWVKLSFILLEFALAIAFGVSQRVKRYNAAAILEWVIAFFYFFYVLSFFMDFMPAVRSKNHQSHETEMDMANEESGQRHGMRGHDGDGAADGARYYRGGVATAPLDGGEALNGNGNAYEPGRSAPLTSRNF